MPSTPPTSLPFGPVSQSFIANTKALFSYLSNLVNKQHLQYKLAQFNPNLGTVPVDIGLLESKDLSLEGSLQRTTDLVASSVRSSLKSFNPSNPTKYSTKVLVYGTHSYYRAKYLTSVKDYPNTAYLLQSAVVDAAAAATIIGLGSGLGSANTDQLSGGIYWTEDIAALDTVQSATFDAVLCFNMGVESAPNTLNLINKIERILRPGGTVAGTGLFKNTAGLGLHTSNQTPINAPIDLNQFDSQAAPSPADCLSASCFSLRSFRDSVESIGFYMHACIDLSMEGNVMLQVVEDVRDADSPLYLFRSGKLLCARFLATKNNHYSISNYNEDNPIMTLSTTPDIANQTLINMSNNLNSNNNRLNTNSTSNESIDPIVITGVSLGLPNSLYINRSVFSSDNFDSIWRGDNFISNLTEENKSEILSMNVFTVYKKDGKRVKSKLNKDSEVIQLASRIGEFNLHTEYPAIPNHICETLDTTYELAIAAGLEALNDAQIPVITTTTLSDGTIQHSIVGLPEHMRDETGVIFASSFPAADSLVAEVSKAAAYKAIEEFKSELNRLNIDYSTAINPATAAYEYDRKLLFKLLVMANCQLAELIKARGPNTHLNNACSGTTQAITLAEDWIRVGRCRRVIVISADNATSKELLPYLGTGFLALGAASINPLVSDAAVPFDARRKGMILGAGAVGLVIECASASLARSIQPKVEIVGSLISNSAFHATLMDRESTSNQLAGFISKIELELNIDRDTLAKDCIYLAHETCTSANGGCAKVETDALQFAFGDSKKHLIVTNVKGFTGHPMGVGFEDVIAVESLMRGRVPPVANHKQDDPCLQLLPHQKPTRENNYHQRQFVLRFAAGFGSQFVYILYRLYPQSTPLLVNSLTELHI